MNCSHGVVANYSEGGSADLTWWPDLAWRGSKKFTECQKWMSLKIKKISARYILPFGNDTRKTWEGGFWSPPPKNRVNLPLAGEGHLTPRPPLANFPNNLKTSAYIDAKRTVTYTPSIWHIHTQFQRNPFHFIFLENDVLVTSCHAILGLTIVNINWLLECRVLTQNASNKRRKMPNWTFYKWLSHIFIFWPP